MVNMDGLKWTQKQDGRKGRGEMSTGNTLVQSGPTARVVFL